MDHTTPKKKPMLMESDAIFKTLTKLTAEHSNSPRVSNPLIHLIIQVFEKNMILQLITGTDNQGFLYFEAN